VSEFADRRFEDDGARAAGGSASARRRVQRRAKATGLPDHLKSAVEGLSGVSLDDVRVRYGSSKPASVDAVAFTHGSRIEIAPGQERHIAHEAWHAVQQRQGRAQTRIRLREYGVDDDAGLEREADVMGARASALARRPGDLAPSPPAADLAAPSSPVIQREMGIGVNERVQVVVKERIGLLSQGTYLGKVTAVNDKGDQYKIEFDDKDAHRFAKNRDFAEAAVTRLVAKVVEKPKVHRNAPWEGAQLGLQQATKDAVEKIVGDATTLEEISEEQVGELIELFKKTKDSTGTLEFAIGSLETDLKNFEQYRQKPEEIESRRAQITKDMEQTEEAAFTKRFGAQRKDANFAQLSEAIDKWWLEVKGREKDIEFTAAYQANRMTARQINLKGRRGIFQARHHDPQSNKASRP
jgi:hypothetical protein